MVEYFCAWKDRRGGIHASQKEAEKADDKYAIEDEVNKRVAKLKYEFNRLNVDLPYMRSSNHQHYDYYRETGWDADRETLARWIINHAGVINEVING